MREEDITALICLLASWRSAQKINITRNKLITNILQLRFLRENLSENEENDLLCTFLSYFWNETRLNVARNVRELVKKCMNIHSNLLFVFFGSFWARERRFYSAYFSFRTCIFSLPLVNYTRSFFLTHLFFRKKIVKNRQKLANGKLKRRNYEFEWIWWEIWALLFLYKLRTSSICKCNDNW